MATMNISLTSEQIKFVDNLREKLGYATRSELVRHMLRVISRDPQIVTQADSTFPFEVTPRGQRVSQVVGKFKETGLYSKQFLKDLEEGLRANDYFISD